MINGMNYAPPRSDLQDRCFQIKLLCLSEKTRKSNEELEKKFQERGPYILGALFDALSAALNEKDVPEFVVDVRMKDACQFIMKVSKTGKLPFNEDTFRVNPDSEEVVVWKDATGKLLKELKERALALEKSGSNGSSKYIPSSPQKLGGELTKYEKLLNEEAIYLDRTARTSKRRTIRLIYRPFNENQASKTEQPAIVATR